MRVCAYRWTCRYKCKGENTCRCRYGYIHGYPYRWIQLHLLIQRGAETEIGMDRDRKTEVDVCVKTLEKHINIYINTYRYI